MKTNGRFSSQAIEIVKRHVERERVYARYTITIDDAGEVLSTTENPLPQIDVLAIIGPAEIEGCRLEEVLLLEIGINRSAPYKLTHGLNNGGNPVKIGQRARYAQISKVQLEGVFPHIQTRLVDYMRQVSAGWKFTQFTLPHQYGDPKVKKVRQRGLFYSVSIDDREMFATVLRSERFCREISLEPDLEMAAQKISSSVEKYKNQKPTEKQFRQMSKYKHMRNLLAFLDRRNFHPHHLYFIRKYLVKNLCKGIVLFDYILERRGVDVEEMYRWGELAWSDGSSFEGVYVRCVPNKWREKRIWSIRYGKFVLTKKNPNRLSFEIADHECPF